MNYDELISKAIEMTERSYAPYSHFHEGAALLDKAGVLYEPVDANEEVDLVEKYGIKQAPTLVLVGDDDFEKHKGVSNIKGWIKSQKK